MIVEGSSTGATPGITAAPIVLITGSTDHHEAVADMAVTAMMVVALLLLIVIIHLTLAGDGSIEAVFLRPTLTMDMVQGDGFRDRHRRIVVVRLYRHLTLTTVGITAFITIVDRLTLTTGWEDLRLRPLTTITILTPRPL